MRNKELSAEEMVDLFGKVLASEEGAPRSLRTTIKTTPEILIQLRSVASAIGISQTRIVADAIETYLDNKTWADLHERLTARREAEMAACQAARSNRFASDRAY